MGEFADKKIALFGLGASGLATARALKNFGAQVCAWDDSVHARDGLAGIGLTPVDLNAVDWSEFYCLVLTPGVPLTHPVPHWTAQRAKRAGVPIWGDLEIFARQRAMLAPNAPLVAITGTNGKSTTTALIAHVLQCAGRPYAMGGNIGVPVFDLPPPAMNFVHVLECSSYQIDLAPSLNPSVGILLNITPDHLDRHGDLENYAAVKERLVSNSTIALVGVDDLPSRAIAQRLKERAREGRKIIAISAQNPSGADYWVSGHLVSDIDGAAPLDLRRAEALRGTHNAQNAVFAYVASLSLGIKGDVAGKAIESFPGLAHRLEPLGRIGKVLFVNDSKATNADAAEKALTAYRDIYWIVGGKPKQGGIASLRRLFSHVAKAYLIGEASDEFAATLNGALPYERCGTLEIATRNAARDAAASDGAAPVVLLAPACASFDQFANFEQRGEAFRGFVNALRPQAEEPSPGSKP